MKTARIWIIVGACLIMLGMIVAVAALAMESFDLNIFVTTKYETNTYEITEGFSNISIDSDTADIVFVISENENCKVVCYESVKQNHDTFVNNDTLHIKINDQRKWFEYIGITTDSPEITVYLPTAEYGTLTVKESTGDVALPRELSFDNIDITTSTGDVRCLASATEDIKINTDTGDIQISQISAKNVKLSVSTGRITAGDITCAGDVTVTVSTGKATLTDVSCLDLISDGSTGDLVLTNVVATGKFFIERSTGDVRFDACDAAELLIETDTGDVEGSLLTEKIFFVESDTGRINVPRTTNGGKCEITTDTGDVKIVIQ